MTTMTPNEIIGEFNRNYPEIQRRMRSYLMLNKNALIQRFKRGYSYVKPAEPRTTCVNGNRYRISLNIEVCKFGFKKFEMHIYQILTDAKTGKIRIWLLTSVPEDLVIEFKPDFIKRVYPDLPLKSAIDKFMEDFTKYTAYKRPDSNSYNLEASFDGLYIGFGFEEPGKYLFERVYKDSEIVSMGEEIGLSGNVDPLNVYNLWIEFKESKKIPDIIGDNLTEEEKRRLEIELAWKEFEGSNN
jgi:hypothetical protein